MFATPEVSGGRLFAGSCAGRFMSFDPRSGKTLWSYDITADGEQTSFHGNMLLTDDLVVIGTDDGDGHVYAFEQETGKVRWKLPVARGVATDVQRDGDRLYVVTLEDELTCIDLESGKVVWTLQSEAEASPDFDMGSTPALDHNGRVFFGGRDGVVYALDSNDGRLIWKTPLSFQVSTSVLLHGGRLVVGTWDAELCLLNPETGETETVVTLDRSLKGPLVAVGELIIAYGPTWESELTAIDVSTGKAKWFSSPPAGERWSTPRPFVIEPWVLGGTTAGIVHAVALSDGKIVWSYPLDESRDWEDDAIRVFGLHDDTLYVGTTAGTLYALDRRR